MNSFEMKTKVMHYMRFNRRYPYVSTEAGYFNCDVLAAKDGPYECVEVEVKFYRTDLLADMKKRKHALYKKTDSTRYNKHIPNKFYFAVPTELLSDALALVKGTGYGVLEVLDLPMVKGNKKNVYCKTAVSAKSLHEGVPTKLFRDGLMRMSCELVSLRMYLSKANQIRETIE